MKNWKTKNKHIRTIGKKKIPVRSHKQRYSKNGYPSVSDVMFAYKRLSPLQEIILSRRVKYIPINEMTPIERQKALKIIKIVNAINADSYVRNLTKPIPKWNKIDFQITNDELERLLQTHYGKEYWKSKKFNEIGMLLFGFVENNILKITNFEVITNDMFISKNWKTLRQRSAYQFDVDDITKTIIEQFEKGLVQVGELHTHPAYVGQRGGVNPGNNFNNTVSQTDFSAWKSIMYPYNNVGGVINININGESFVVLYFKNKIVFSRWIRK